VARPWQIVALVLIVLLLILAIMDRAILQPIVSLGAGACCHVWDEHEVPVGVMTNHYFFPFPLTPPDLARSGHARRLRQHERPARVRWHDPADRTVVRQFHHASSRAIALTPSPASERGP